MKVHKFFFLMFMIALVLFFFAVVKPQFFAGTMYKGQIVAMADKHHMELNPAHVHYNHGSLMQQDMEAIHDHPAGAAQMVKIGLVMHEMAVRHG